MSGQKRKVLLVDQGLSFGGALVVLASIARNLGDRYEPIIITAIQGNVGEWIDTDGIVIESCTPEYSYVDIFRLQARARKLKPRLLGKLFLYAGSALGFLKNMAYVRRICLLIAKHDIDVVHANVSIYVLMAAFIMRRPCYWHFHGAVTEGPTLLQRILGRRLAGFIAISDFVAQSAIKHGYPESRITTLPNPVGDHVLIHGNQMSNIRAQTRAKFNVADEECLFAIFGRFIRWKGQLEVVKAFESIRDDIAAKLIVIGDASEGFNCDYAEEVKHFVSSVGLQDRVIFAGFTKDVRSMYLAADVVVHASIEPEPFGLVVIEAMAMGRPVIASDLGAPPELVEEDGDGFIVSPTDTPALADRMRRLAQDPELRRQMGDKGKTKVGANYMPQQYAARVANLYERCLSGTTHV